MSRRGLGRVAVAGQAKVGRAAAAHQVPLQHCRAKLFQSITSEQNAVCKKRIAIITGKTQQLREVLADQEHLERMNALQTQENNHFLQKCQSFSTDMQERMARIGKLKLSELASKKKLQEEMEKNAFLKFL